MTQFRQKLIYRFRKQEDFSEEYSPLYSAIFGAQAHWLADQQNEVGNWLVEFGTIRTAFDIPLLLVAGLHREVLMGNAPELAQFYPTAGGERPFTSPNFLSTLHQTILTHRQTLAPFIQTATVQTNETGRGLCWLLPLHYVNYDGTHLVDLGASAGLNLVAEQRAYRLVDSDESELQKFGTGSQPQFTTHCKNRTPNFPISNLPRILSRTGCDIHPFVLETAGHEQTLAAYVWGDQPHRLVRLREGIDAFRATEQTDAPVQLYQTNLPDDLPHFLGNLKVGGETAVSTTVLYNTYITQYLPQKGQLLRQHITEWAIQQNSPILWLQWEPDRSNQDGPEYGWLKWTADLWHADNYYQFHLGWVHPHGTHAQFEPDFERFINYFS